MDDRRKEPDPKRRERRVIPRFSDSNLRVYAKRVSILCKVWIIISLIYFLVWTVIRLSGKIQDIPYVGFCGAILIVISYQVQKLSHSLRLFSESESQARLIVAIEDCFSLLFTLTVVSLLFATVNILAML